MAKASIATGEQCCLQGLWVFAARVPELLCDFPASKQASKQASKLRICFLAFDPSLEFLYAEQRIHAPNHLPVSL
jgi:hypothetical protein